jgi:hypothetical protein
MFDGPHKPAVVRVAESKSLSVANERTSSKAYWRKACSRSETHCSSVRHTLYFRNAGCLICSNFRLSIPETQCVKLRQGAQTPSAAFAIIPFTNDEKIRDSRVQLRRLLTPTQLHQLNSRQSKYRRKTTGIEGITQEDVNGEPRRNELQLLLSSRGRRHRKSEYPYGGGSRMGQCSA